MFVLSGFLLGMASSLHCVGMCGPIVIAMNRVNGLNGKGWERLLLYHGGRVSTYIILGFLAGLLGLGVRIGGWQQWLSIISGIMILAIYFLPRTGWFKGTTINFQPVTSRISKQMQKRTLLSSGVTGMLNGLLPCGMVYVAVAGSLAGNSLVQSAGFMAMFGLGTTGALVGVSLGGGWLGKRLAKVSPYVIPTFVCIIGCLFILRGMGLGIPFISPAVGHSCH
jgi:sulfite exporter TauE/SafE